MQPGEIYMQRLVVVLLVAALAACGGGEPTGAADDTDAAPEAVAWRGETTAFDGYTLFQPMHSTSIYLVDMDGELVHRWETEYNPGQSVYMLENGNLLRAARDPRPPGPFRGGGEGGIIQEIAWTAPWCGSTRSRTTASVITTTSSRCRTATSS